MSRGSIVERALRSVKRPNGVARDHETPTSRLPADRATVAGNVIRSTQGVTTCNKSFIAIPS